MIKHTRSRLISIISAMVILSLIFPIQLLKSKATVKVEQPSSDNTYPEMMAKFEKYAGELDKGHPDVAKSFFEFHQAVLKPGALDAKAKVLISLGIAVSTGCDGCIAYHTLGSLEAGATEEEIMEALWVAVFMGGGPSFVYATHAIEALEQFKATEK